MFPVCDLRGRVLGFGARKLGSARGPKYVNSPNGAIYCKSELLYGAHQARAIAAKSGIAIVVEGYIDALSMHQAGMVNTVALMGTSITEHQIAKLKKLAPTAVLMLDGDYAGDAAVLRAGVLARPLGLEVLVATLPARTDPADLLQREGAAIIRELVAEAGAFARFRVQRHLERAEIGTAEAKDRLIHELQDVFADIQPSAVREDLIARVARHLKLDPSLVSTWLSGPESHAETWLTGVSAGALVPTTTAHEGSRGLLLESVANPEIAARLPSGDALERLFPDSLQRRAAEHIRGHAHDPAAELPDDDDELVALITSLLTAPIGAAK
jgi:DNA primase